MDKGLEHFAANDDELLLDDPDLLLAEEAATCTDISWDDAPAAPLPSAAPVPSPSRHHCR